MRLLVVVWLLPSVVSILPVYFYRYTSVRSMSIALFGVLDALT